MSQLTNRLSLLGGALAAAALCAAPAATGQGTAPQAALTRVSPSGPNSLEVDGTVTPGNSATTVVVDYGTTPRLGSQTAPITIGAGPQQVPFAASVTGLASGTLYYVEIVATDASGSGSSSIGSATTEASGPGSPGPSTTGSASGHLAASVLRPGLPYADLAGVACVGASFCQAVGGFGSGFGQARSGGGWAASYNGRSWRTTVTRGSMRPGFSAVTCTSRSFCMTVGANNQQTIGERWNGRRWSAVSTITPAGGGDEGLTAVSCTASRNCWAVGFTHGAMSTPADELLEHWNGSRWSLASPGPIHGFLTSISCASASSCWVTGLSTALAHWNGSRWRLVSLDGKYTQTIVSCPKATECWVLAKHGYLLAALHLVGSRWSSAPIASGPQLASDTIQGVACGSEADCWAVGSGPARSGSTASAPFAEQWDGSAWKVAKLTGSAAARGYLTAVACGSSTACVAVGASGGATSSKPLVASSGH